MAIETPIGNFVDPPKDFQPHALVAGMRRKPAIRSMPASIDAENTFAKRTKALIGTKSIKVERNFTSPPPINRNANPKKPKVRTKDVQKKRASKSDGGNTSAQIRKSASAITLMTFGILMNRRSKYATPRRTGPNRKSGSMVMEISYVQANLTDGLSGGDWLVTNWKTSSANDPHSDLA